MDRWRVSARLLPLGALLLIIPACGSSTTSTQATTTTTAAKNFQVTTPEGQASLSLDGHLPPNWPQGFPLPAGSTPAGSGSLGGSTSGAMVAVYRTTTAAPQAYSFYTSNPDLTTSSAGSAGVGSAFVGRVTLTAPYTGSVTTLALGDSPYIVIVLTGGSGTTTTSPTT